MTQPLPVPPHHEPGPSPDPDGPLPLPGPEDPVPLPSPEGPILRSPPRVASSLLVALLALGATLTAPDARSQGKPAAPPPAAPPAPPAAPPGAAPAAPAGDGDVDVVEVGGAVRSLPRVLFVPADTASAGDAKEMARLVALTGLFTTSTLAAGSPAGGLWVRVATSSSGDQTTLEATTTPKQGDSHRRLLVVGNASRALDQARLADAIVADLTGERSHLSGTLLIVDAGAVGERRVKVILGAGSPVRDVSPPDLLARGADTTPAGKVFYAAGRQGEPLRIHAEGATTPVGVRVAGYLQSVAFAPDGRAAVIAGEREGGALWVGQLDGAMTRVDTGAGMAFGPSFGPGNQLAYAAGPITGPLRVFLDGKAISQAGVWASAPSFCPRATRPGETPKLRVAYMVKQGDTGAVIVTEPETGATHTVGSGSFPACSPDGRTVAVSRPRRGKTPGGVWLIGDDGIAAHRAREGEAVGIRWYPGPALPPEG